MKKQTKKSTDEEYIRMHQKVIHQIFYAGITLIFILSMFLVIYSFQPNYKITKTECWNDSYFLDSCLKNCDRYLDNSSIKNNCQEDCIINSPTNRCEDKEIEWVLNYSDGYVTEIIDKNDINKEWLNNNCECKLNECLGSECKKGDCIKWACGEYEVTK